LQVLCKECHKAKTAAYNSKRMRATGAVFSKASAPRHLSMLFLSPTLVSSPPMADSPKS
jgi:hypothetical protein